MKEDGAMSFEDRNNPCGICQSDTFIWGEPVSDNGVWFRTDDPEKAVLGSASGLMGRHGMILRVCSNCGNVQWFLRYYPEPDEEKKKNG
jgi:hypothetical protein